MQKAYFEQCIFLHISVYHYRIQYIINFSMLLETSKMNDTIIHILEVSIGFSCVSFLRAEALLLKA